MTPAPLAATRVPRWCLFAALLYAPLLLFIDGRLSSPCPWEYVLGAVTFAVLAWWTSHFAPRDRVQVWVLVGVATVWEYVGSQIWGGYRYRFGMIPAYVPFGHGLVYAFSLSLAATPFVVRHERRIAYATLALVWAWAVAGVTVLPAFTHRVDWHGWYWLWLFTLAILAGPRKALFAGIFIAVTDLELSGTAFGCWTWAPLAPWMHVASGNPPSAVAGGYAVIDGSVMLIVALLASCGRGWTRLTSLAGSSSASRAPSAAGATRASATR